MTLTDDIPYDPFGRDYRPMFTDEGLTQPAGWCAPVDDVEVRDLRDASIASLAAGLDIPVDVLVGTARRSTARERRRARHRQWQHSDRASRSGAGDVLARDPRA